MRRAILAVCIALAIPPVVGAFWAADAGAKAGLTGITVGPRLPSPTTFTVGPAYYSVSEPTGARLTAREASEGAGSPEALNRFLRAWDGARERAECAEARAGYFGRHGVTTPQPLKGFHGCAKARLDAAYWRKRRNEPAARVPNAAYAVQNQIVLTLHDLTIGAIP